ncbi:MAG: hypothetical protein ROW48_02210 [Bellilinea sp.]
MTMLALMLALPASVSGQEAQPPAPTETGTSAIQTTTSLFLPLISSWQPPPAPPYATSIYIQNPTTSALTGLGCAQGTRDHNLPGSQDNLIVLAFGKMWLVNGEYRVRTYTNPSNGLRFNLTFGELEELARDYILGYLACSDGVSLLTLAIGVTNYDDMNVDNNVNRFSSDQGFLRSTAYAFGQRFADLAQRLNAWLARSGYRGRVWTMGAMDIEWSGQECNNDRTYCAYWWNTPHVTRGWVDGFNANDGGAQTYLNFGACVGCPIVPSLTWRYHRDLPWTQADVYYVSWGAPPALPLPQIYRNDGYLAKQWQAVSLYGDLHLGGAMVFAGVMTQYQACQQRTSDSLCPILDNTPEEGWTQMMNELNRNANTAQSVLRWVTDIRWQIR